MPYLRINVLQTKCSPDKMLSRQNALQAFTKQEVIIRQILRLQEIMINVQVI